MKNLICILFIVLSFFSCQEKLANPGPQKFNLTGKTNNLPDGTVIYVVDILTNQVFDSVSILKNSFQIERDLSVSPANIYLHTKNYAELKSFWAENKSMVFDASESTFEKAKISGSKTQLEFEPFMAQIDTIGSDEKIEALAMNFIHQYRDNRAGASMLAGYAPNWDKSKVSQLFNGLSKENKASVYGLQIAKYIELNRKHEVGDQFTDFEMKNPQGTTLKLSQNLGRVTLLEFWASWCGPCRKQNPDLVKTYEKYKNAGFEIFSVSLDFSKDDWEKAIKDDGLTWKQASDLKGRNSTGGITYGVNMIPDNFLIDEHGNIIAKYLWGEELNDAIEEALGIK